MPPVLWDRVTLTCQGSGSAGATTWYRNGQRWWQQGRDRLIVTHSGTYACHRPGSGLSPTMNISDDWLVLQVPARALLQGDTVTLRCRSWEDNPITSVSFYHEEEELGVFPNGTQLSLSPLQLNHSGRYSYWLVLQVPARALLEGDTVTLRCRSWRDKPITSVSFYHEEEELGVFPNGTQLSLSPLQLNHSGRYSCKGQVGSWGWQESAPVTVTVHVSPRATTLQDPQVTHAELRGPQGQPWEPGDIYGNVL
ncbi:unnamed protein product [Coccothraustes coccothraustes]